MDKRGRPGFVTFTLDIPIEVAEYLTKHGQEVINGLQRAVTRYHQNPPIDPAKGQKTAEDLAGDRRAIFKAHGRNGYRRYRRLIDTDGYFTTEGVIRGRANLSRPQWRKLILNDIADELGIPHDLAELAIRKFRADLNSRIKPRREQAITRLFLEGLSNRNIADRVGVSVTHVVNFIKANREHLRTLFRELPEGHKLLKRKKRLKVPGSSQRQTENAPGNLPGKHTGDSN